MSSYGEPSRASPEPRARVAAAARRASTPPPSLATPRTEQASPPADAPRPPTAAPPAHPPRAESLAAPPGDGRGLGPRGPPSQRAAANNISRRERGGRAPCNLRTRQSLGVARGRSFFRSMTPLVSSSGTQSGLPSLQRGSRKPRHTTTRTQRAHKSILQRDVRQESSRAKEKEGAPRC